MKDKKNHITRILYYITLINCYRGKGHQINVYSFVPLGYQLNLNGTPTKLKCKYQPYIPIPTGHSDTFQKSKTYF